MTWDVRKAGWCLGKGLGAGAGDSLRPAVRLSDSSGCGHGWLRGAGTVAVALSWEPCCSRGHFALSAPGHALCVTQWSRQCCRGRQLRMSLLGARSSLLQEQDPPGPWVGLGLSHHTKARLHVPLRATAATRALVNQRLPCSSSLTFLPDDK